MKLHSKEDTIKTISVKIWDDLDESIDIIYGHFWDVYEDSCEDFNHTFTTEFQDYLSDQFNQHPFFDD